MPTIEPDQCDVPLTENGAFVARIRWRGFDHLRRYLAATGHLDRLPKKSGLAKSIAVHRARWQAREAREHGGNEGIMRQMAEEWLDSLCEYPLWVIDAAFRYVNRSAQHPPRPGDVATVCEEIWHEPKFYIQRARAIVQWIETNKPEWA